MIGLSQLRVEKLYADWLVFLTSSLDEHDHSEKSEEDEQLHLLEIRVWSSAKMRNYD